MEGILAQRVLDYAGTHDCFSKKELLEVLGKGGEIKSSTLGWLLYELVHAGRLMRVRRGVYALQRKIMYVPEVTERMHLVAKLVREEFPFAPFCVFSGDFFAGLQHHLSVNHLIYLEVDRGMVDYVVEYLREKKVMAFATPTEKEFDTYIDPKVEDVVVLPSVTQAPIQKVHGIPVSKIEKLLVDLSALSCFRYIQGVEYDRIFENAYRIYAIQEDTLLRYAARRHVEEEIRLILETVKGYD